MIPPSELVLASHNAGKLKELQAMLGAAVRVRSIGEFSDLEPEETGLTFVENAILKARHAARVSGLPALADDSGLVVHGLDGRPGVHSARWAGLEGDFGRAMARVRDELGERFGSFAAADRRAEFVAVLCLAWPDGHEELVEGRVAGLIVDPPRGQGGFGYDPIFQPLGASATFAEMPREAKQAQSHRGRALRRLLELCFSGP